jgi:hypothetical protein
MTFPDYLPPTTYYLPPTTIFDKINNDMKKVLYIFGVLAMGIAAYSFTVADPETLAIGAAAPKTDLKMDGIDGKSVSLSDLKKANGLAVIFTSNTCPFVVGAEGYGEGWETRYLGLQKAAGTYNVGLVLINSNEAKRANGESMEDMKKRATDKRFSSIAYLLDKNSELANAFGARTTPHVFLFDKDMKLVYRGAIDNNNESAAKVTDSYLEKAMINLSQGKAIAPAETKATGCGIKRVG